MFSYKKIALLSSIFFVATVQATAYIEMSGYSWGSPGLPYTSNRQAMDLAFGSGNWSEYSELDGATPFLPAAGHDFIMIEGSTPAAETLKAYLITYNSEITSFVNNGGALYINVAVSNNSFPNTPLVDRYIETGFGDIIISSPPSLNSYAGVTDPSHEIFTNYNSPILPDAADLYQYEGDEFAHGQVSGTGLTSILEGSDNSVLNGEIVLAEIKDGAKQVCVLFGTITPYIETQPKGTNLQTSILKYAQACSKLSPPTPPTPPTGEAKAIPATSLWQVILSMTGLLFFSLVVFRKFKS